MSDPLNPVFESITIRHPEREGWVQVGSFGDGGFGIIAYDRNHQPRACLLLDHEGEPPMELHHRDGGARVLVQLDGAGNPVFEVRDPEQRELKRKNLVDL